MAELNSQTKLKSPRFFAFLMAQFLGAANDNAFKMTIVAFISASITTGALQLRYNSLTSFIMPIAFLLFSPVAGYFADRYSKHRVLLVAKIPEIFAMLIAIWGLHTGNLVVLWCSFFFMCTQSSFFGPAKYGLMPEVFSNKDLSMANGILHMTTNVAILFGTILGGIVYGFFKTSLAYVGVVYVAIACLGTFVVCFVPRGKPGNTNAPFTWNVFSSFTRDFAEVKKLPVLFYTLLGIAYFYFLGALLITIIPVYSSAFLKLPEFSANAMIAILSIGIALGSIFAGKLSQGKVELGLVPLGGLGISLFSLDMVLFGNSSLHLFLYDQALCPVRVAVDLFLMGISSGMFIVPLNALLQQVSPEGSKGRFIAFSNIISFSAVMLSAGFSLTLAEIGLDAQSIFLIISVLTFIATIFILNLLPDFFIRLVLWILTNTVYRIKVVGSENIPRKGALFVANHVSWVDALIIAGACDRMIRFMMYRPFYEAKLTHWFFRRMHVIPVAAGDPIEKKKESLQHAANEIKNGAVVCIFAEGQITRTGNLLKFKRGFERIMEGVDCPIVPIYLDGLWGSLFSFKGGKFLFKTPKQIPYPVTVFFGKPQPATTKASELRQVIQDLSAEAIMARRENNALHVEFIKVAKYHWKKLLAAETGREISYGQTLSTAIALSKAPLLRSLNRENIGVILSPCIDTMLINMAIMYSGNTPVNLDLQKIKDSKDILAKANIQKIITTKDTKEKFPEDLTNQEIVVIEDILHPQKIYSSLFLRFFPSKLISSTYKKSCDINKATIFFTSPKNNVVVLSHKNITANIQAVRQVAEISSEDSILGVLPFSYSYGFTVFCLAASCGTTIIYPGDHADNSSVAALAKEYKLSMITCLPNLLEKYSAEISAENFSSLRFVAVAGEELSEQLRDTFMQKYNVEPLEGYGCVECSPLISLNTVDYQQGKDHQTGVRQGSIGHPLPGVSVKIIDPKSKNRLNVEEEGELWVKGANVVSGYLNDAKATEERFSDGWFNTQMHAKMDKDGFVTIVK